MEDIKAIYNELGILFKNFDPEYVIQNGEFSVTRLRIACDKYNKEQFLSALDDFSYDHMNNVARHYAEVNSLLSHSLQRASNLLEERRVNYIKSADSIILIDEYLKLHLKRFQVVLQDLIVTNDSYKEKIKVHVEIGKINDSKVEAGLGVIRMVCEETEHPIRFWLENSPYNLVAPFFDHYTIGDCSIVFTYKGFVDSLHEEIKNSLIAKQSF